MLLSATTKARLQQISANTPTPEILAHRAASWSHLQEVDRELSEFIKGVRPAMGQAEHADALYRLNHETDPEDLAALENMGMPQSAITPAEWEQFHALAATWEGYVGEDGTLYQDSPYAEFDYKWTEALVHYWYYKEFPDEVAPFATTPNVLSVPGAGPVTIALIGDWGTGAYNDFGFSSPSTLVANAVGQLNPDITIHLGDVYYAGLESEETANLLSNGFPAGKLANFTMNSNHEMYAGANGLFGTAFKSRLFVQQKNTSYFAIRTNNWVVIGLDTAYYDTSSFYMDGALTDPHQLGFIRSLNITAQERVIVLTHHNGILYNGQSSTTALLSQVYTALGNRYPDYWYYGHIHNTIVYNNSSAQGQYTCPSGASPQLRCFGASAIPIGNATGLQGSGGLPIAGVDYYATTPMPNPNHDSGLDLRVLNGFATITLAAGNRIVEKVYTVSAQNGARQVWSNGVSIPNESDVETENPPAVNGFIRFLRRLFRFLAGIFGKKNR